MGIFSKKKKKLNKEQTASSKPSTPKKACGSRSPGPTASTYPSSKEQINTNKNTKVPNKISSGAQPTSSLQFKLSTHSKFSARSLISPTPGRSEILETIVDNVILDTPPVSRDPDLEPPFYSVPETPPKAYRKPAVSPSPKANTYKNFTSEPRPDASPPAKPNTYNYCTPEPKQCCTRIQKSVAVAEPRGRSKTPIRTRSPVQSPRSGSPARSPRSGSPARSPRSGSPARSPRSGSPARSPMSRSPARSPRSGSPVVSKSGIHPFPPRCLEGSRNGSNPAAVFCCGEDAFRACPASGRSTVTFERCCYRDNEDVRRPSRSRCVSVPREPNSARSEETLVSGTVKSHNGHMSDTDRSQTTFHCSEVCGDEYGYDESSDECECDPPPCQVQCCCVSCCPPPDTCNFFRIPPPMPCQQMLPGRWCGCCGDSARTACCRQTKNDCCKPVEEKCTCKCRCRPKSRELKGGTLIMGCQCNRKNGLQDDCPRTGCQGSSQCMTQPNATCVNQQFSQGKHLEEKWEKEEKTETKVCYCTSYRSAFGPRTRCGPSCTVKVTRKIEETQMTKREGDHPQYECQNSFSGDGNHCPNGCVGWCNCSRRLSPTVNCYTPPRIVPNIPQLSSGYAIPCVNPMIGMGCQPSCNPGRCG